MLHIGGNFVKGKFEVLVLSSIEVIIGVFECCV